MHGDTPSRTAAKVALNMIVLGTKPETRAVLPDELVDATRRLLRASGAASSTAIRWAGSRLMVRVYDAFDFLMPGQLEAFAHRKAFCERQVRDGILAGADQVLVLGAGYDTLAWRLAAELPRVRFFEVDHPATARLKARGIKAMGQSDNHLLLAEDLGQRSLREALKDSRRWDSGSRSVIVAEGLIQYLAPEQVQALFSACSEVCAPGSRMAFTHISTGKNGRPDAGPWSWLILWLLEKNGEAWRFSLSPAELDQFLEHTGWHNRAEPLGPSTRHGVEYFALATR
jgi:methyltransferase (TIGR00027 family)